MHVWFQKCSLVVKALLSKIIITVALYYELEGKVKTKSWHLLGSERDQRMITKNEQLQNSKQR